MLAQEPERSVGAGGAGERAADSLDVRWRGEGGQKHRATVQTIQDSIDKKGFDIFGITQIKPPLCK